MNEDKGTRYRRAERRLRLLEVAAASLVLTAITITPIGPALSALARALASELVVSAGRPREVASASLILLMVVALCLLAAAPFALRRSGALAARYGTAVTSPGRMARRMVRRGGLFVAAGALTWALFVTLHDLVPLAAGIATAVVALAVAAVVMVAAPWVITWSAHVRPLRDEALTGRLHALASRAQIRLAGLHEWVLGDTDQANAALIGVVGRRRLLISDTLIAGSPADEIDVVVAHEIGHHVHGHTWRRAQRQAAAVLGAAIAAHAAAAGPARLAGTGGPTDPASLPWMLCAAGLVWLVTRPARLSLSRAHEAEADAFALTLTGRPDVLERVLTRLGERNLASDDDSPLMRAFFLTHPPVAARIAAARQAAAAPPPAHPARRSVSAAPDA